MASDSHRLLFSMTRDHCDCTPLSSADAHIAESQLLQCQSDADPPPPKSGSHTRDSGEINYDGVSNVSHGLRDLIIA